MEIIYRTVQTIYAKPKVMTFNLSLLSKYRTELMGISALLILICHSVAYISMPNFMKYTLSLGNIGVDLFLFISGMGLWYSLEKFNSNNRGSAWGGDIILV